MSSNSVPPPPPPPPPPSPPPSPPPPTPPPPPGNFGWIITLFGALYGIPASIRNAAIRTILALIFLPLLTLLTILYPSILPYFTERNIGICYYWSAPWFCTPTIPPPPINDYNVLIDIKSFLLVKEGWEIISDGSQFSTMFLDLDTEYSKSLVAMIGDYDTGKTWTVNNLENANYQSSFQNSTPAFAFVESSISPYVYMDTQGLKRLASSSVRASGGQHSIKDIQAIDNLVSSCYSIADIIIEVRSTGNNDDFCNQEQRHAEYLQDEINPKKIVVVHNFKHLETSLEVERYIQDDITNPEIGGQLVISTTPGTIGCKYWYVGKVYHFVVAKEGSQASKIYNQCTFNLIRLTILPNQAYVPKVNFLKKLFKIFEQSLRNNLKDPNAPKDSFVRVKKNEWKLSYWTNKMNPFSSKPDPEVQIDIEAHPFRLMKENSRIKLENSSINLEFSYKDRCGFKNIDYNPQYELIQNETMFGISIDLPNSYVKWYCSENYSNIVNVYFKRKFPTYSPLHVKNNINRRTYGSDPMIFEIPPKPWITCKSLVSTAVYKDGTAFVLLTQDSSVFAGSPFPEDKK
ncbi:hypothetical protein ACTFIZ_009984 [Dictyostelium cf. discoideum]